MSNLGIQDFWLIESAPECYDKPWAVPGIGESVHSALTRDQRLQFIRAQPFDFSIALWLDRRTRGKLSDMPVCDGVKFVVSPKLHASLEPFFGDSVRSREIEIRSKHKGDVVYKILAIEQGAEAADDSKGAGAFFASGTSKNTKYVDAYGIYFDTSTWNGSDIFRMGPYGNQMAVTKSVADAVLAADLVGVSVVRFDLYKLDYWNRYLETGKTPYQF